jgi:predicted DNA-binding protein YlxM (UPF0122 family)
LKTNKTKEELLQTTIDAQNEILAMPDIAEDINGTKNGICSPFKFNDKVLTEMKEKLQPLIQSIDEKNLNDKIIAAVAKRFEGKSNPEGEAYCKNVLKCSQYLGIGNVDGDRDVFLTKEGIITDGYYILHFIPETIATVNDKTIIKNTSIAPLWVLFNKPNNDGSFNTSKVTTTEDPSASFYKFTITDNLSQKATFEFLNVERAVRDATSSPELILNPVCRIKNALNQNARRIKTVKPGKVIKQNDKWIIDQQAEIEYE